MIYAIVEYTIFVYYIFMTLAVFKIPQKRISKPARIPPQTPPAGGESAEAGRIHIPSQMFRPAESALVLFEKSSSKVYNYSTG